MKELLRIHRLALHPVKVFSIVLGIFLSLSSILLISRWSGIELAETPFLTRPSNALHALFLQQKFVALLSIAFFIALVWAILGGGVTRLMSQDVLEGRHQNLLVAMKFCCRWALFYPSSLASACFFILLLSPWQPWLLLGVLPLWLYAGFIYGALTSENISLKVALNRAHAKIRRWKIWLPLQLRFLIGFCLSTGVVYSLALLAAYGVHLALGGKWDFFSLSPPWEWQGIFVYPILAYALGYTTSNLKSLQIYLYQKVP